MLDPELKTWLAKAEVAAGIVVAMTPPEQAVILAVGDEVLAEIRNGYRAKFGVEGDLPVELDDAAVAEANGRVPGYADAVKVSTDSFRAVMNGGGDS